MRYDDDLHVMDQAVCLAATTHGMIVLSAPPWGDHVEVARWPDGDWNGFLSLGRTLGVRLLYAGLHRLAEHHLHAKRKRYRRLEADAAVWDAARSRLGQPHVLEVAWLYGGVAHYWVAEAAWHRDLERCLHDQNALAGGRRRRAGMVRTAPTAPA